MEHTASQIAAMPLSTTQKLLAEDVLPVTVTGSKASGEALESLLQALAAIGLIKDATTA